MPGLLEEIIISFFNREQKEVDAATAATTATPATTATAAITATTRATPTAHPAKTAAVTTAGTEAVTSPMTAVATRAGATTTTATSTTTTAAVATATTAATAALPDEVKSRTEAKLGRIFANAPPLREDFPLILHWKNRLKEIFAAESSDTEIANKIDELFDDIIFCLCSELLINKRLVAINKNVNENPEVKEQSSRLKHEIRTRIPIKSVELLDEHRIATIIISSCFVEFISVPLITSFPFSLNHSFNRLLSTRLEDAITKWEVEWKNWQRQTKESLAKLQVSISSHDSLGVLVVIKNSIQHYLNGNLSGEEVINRITKHIAELERFSDDVLPYRESLLRKVTDIQTKLETILPLSRRFLTLEQGARAIASQGLSRERVIASAKASKVRLFSAEKFPGLEVLRVCGVLGVPMIRYLINQATQEDLNFVEKSGVDLGVTLSKQDTKGKKALIASLENNTRFKGIKHAYRAYEEDLRNPESAGESPADVASSSSSSSRTGVSYSG